MVPLIMIVYPVIKVFKIESYKVLNVCVQQAITNSTGLAIIATLVAKTAQMDLNIHVLAAFLLTSGP